MNPFLILIIALPVMEIILIINIGQAFGSINTILLILFTAILGIYFARAQGFNTLRSGLKNIYKNEIPIFEIISGASIAVAAFLLILPGFITDTFGFILLIPYSRKLLINFFISKNKLKKQKDDTIEAEIVEDKNDKL
jgi:UPF0716 protein FxsA